MSLMFLPPTAYVRPMTTPRPHPGNSLYRHYRPIEAGINVWLMPGGVVTTQDPADGSEVRVFHGGHLHPVDDAEAAALIAAGYSANIVGLPDDPVVVVPPVDPEPEPVVVVVPVLTITEA